MAAPFWFRIIEQWKEQGKGEYGVTFPFLVGSVSRTTGKPANEALVREIFQEIISNPVKDYYCEVRWCGNINEPVASVKELEKIHGVSIKSQFEAPSTGAVSLAFTTDLMSMFNLDCSNNNQCLEKLSLTGSDGLTATGRGMRWPGRRCFFAL